MSDIADSTETEKLRRFSHCLETLFAKLVVYGIFSAIKTKFMLETKQILIKFSKLKKKIIIYYI